MPERFRRFLPDPYTLRLYILAMRSLYRYEKAQVSDYVEERVERHPDIRLKQAIQGYVIAALCGGGGGHLVAAFNIAILAIDDLTYLPDPPFADVSISHAASAFSTMMMSGLAVVGLVLRPQSRVYRSLSSISVLLVIYLLNTLFLYLYGH